MSRKQHQIRVSLLAVPDSFMSCLTGLYDTLVVSQDVVPGEFPITVEIVAPTRHSVIGTSRMPIVAHRTLDEISATDIVVIPASVMNGNWQTGRYPAVVDWLRRMHARGAILCSACSGAFLLAETGLLDGHEATTHWTLEKEFNARFPEVSLKPERELIITGEGQRLVMSGASTAWHDLALYLVARFSGPGSARSVAKFFMLNWHSEGQAPYLSFKEDTSHGDSAVVKAQVWLQGNWKNPRPVAAMVTCSGLSERNFKRRFRTATGFSPIDYVQRLRVEYAKQHLETSAWSVEEVGWNVGYEDPSFFRRLFKRVTGVTPREYRRRFSAPYARGTGSSNAPLVHPI